MIWAGLIIWATTNAVNVTDGLDGLAGGSALMGFGAFMIIGYWAFRNPEIYGAVVNPLDLAALAAAFAGACMGFLWFNAAPGRIIMGDVGALGLGSALALLALTMNTQLLLVLICGLNVMEAGSVALQMGVFKASGRKQRLFRMSPIHHHFELVGWPETTVIIRFWLIAAICVAAALGLFIGDFTRISSGSAVRSLVYGLAVAGAATVRALPRAGSTSSPSTTRSTPAGGRWPRSSASSWSSRPTTDASSPGSSPPATSSCRRPACPRPTACSPSPRPPGARSSARSSWPTGGSRSARGPAADARRHRHRRQDDDDAPGRRDARRRRVRAVAAGNTDVPLVAGARPRRRRLRRRVHELPPGVDRAFRGDAAAWLNLAPDHLNWHASMATYEAGQGARSSPAAADDVAIGFAADPVVMAHLARRRAAAARSGWPAPTTASRARARRRSSGTGRRRSPAMRRALPHDLTNGLAAAALVLEAGLAGPTPWPPALARFVGPRTASSWSARPAACAGSTTPRRRRRTPPRRHPGLRSGRAHRRRAQQGPRPGADGRRGRSASGRRRHRRGGRRRRGHVRRPGPWSRRRRWPRPSSGPASWPGAATSSCSRRAAPASTGTPTAGTPPAATTSAASSRHGTPRLEAPT